MASARKLLGRFAILVLAILASAVFLASGCTGGSTKTDRAVGDWPSRLDLRLEQGDDGLLLVMEGVADWYVNALYPGIAVTLLGEDGREVATLGRAQVRFEERGGEDKAKRAAFIVPEELRRGMERLRGTYRAVVCTEDVCSPPFSGEFSLQPPVS